MVRYTPPSVLPPREPSLAVQLRDYVITYGGVLYCIAMMIIIFYTARVVACPEVYGEDYCSDELDIWAFIIIVELAVNLACFLYYSKENKVEHWQRHSVVASLCRNAAEESQEDGDAISIEMNDQKNAGKFCVECNRWAPVRSHHCPLCKQCVLRKDHHCYITGACVGLGNQRYFIVFLTWATIGCALGANYIFWHMDKSIAPWYPFGVLQYIAPVAVVKWFIGSATLSQVALCIVFSFAGGSCVAALGFVASQIFYTLEGYTMFEYHSLSIREAYDGDGQSMGERMRLVFGPWWMLNFFIPAIWSKQRLTPEIADNLFRVRSKLL